LTISHVRLMADDIFPQNSRPIFRRVLLLNAYSN
jgi:hypothetical protein